MLHPVALAALLVLVVNDHVLKRYAPGALSGKLSDVAILVVGPLFLQALWELATSHRAAWKPSRTSLIGACVVTAAAFVFEKTLPIATEAYRMLWGALRWPLDALWVLVCHRGLPGFTRVAAVTDPSDLATLPALAGAWWVNRTRVGVRAPDTTSHI
jgi:hypothetical protein